MHKAFLTLLLIGSLMACENKDSTAHSESVPVQTDRADEVVVIEKFASLAPVFAQQNDTTYVVNFWATSCPPCIKEMPYFAALEQQYQQEKLTILLVSLDMKKDLDSRVKSFIKKHEIKPEVVLLADQNYSAWTDQIDSSWFGALPATLIVKNGKRKFHFGAFENYQDLEQNVQVIFGK